jgi:hypothetical protein
MTLRQQYARPRPHTLAGHTSQPGRAPSSHQPRQDQPTASARPRRRNCRSNPANQGQAVPIAALRPEILSAAAGLHRLDTCGLATPIRPFLHSRLPEDAAGSWHSRPLPARPVSITCGLPRLIRI